MIALARLISPSAISFSNPSDRTIAPTLQARNNKSKKHLTANQTVGKLKRR